MTTAWIAGGSGLVGGALLRLLLDGDHFDKVVSVARRRLPIEHPKLVQIQTEFNALDPLRHAATPTAALCCIGTTIKKSGYDRLAFRMVDHDSVVAFAEMAKGAGARVFVHVTSLGADPSSRVFYNAVKGETERDVAALGFPSVYALRPSILDGHRTDSRPGERFALTLARAIGPILGKYRPTPATSVARAMVSLAVAPAQGAHIVESQAIRSF